MMPDYLLYHMPGSCSHVAINALEELGTSYREKGVALLRGEQRQPDYLAINPKGKVPVLIADGVTITELPAILYHLATANSETRLLPLGSDGRPGLEGLSDLIWMSGALHPIVNRIFRPTGMSTVDADGVKAAAIGQFADHATAISARLFKNDWWTDGSWSIADTFLAWLFDLGEKCGFPLTDYPVLIAHRARVQERPTFARAVAREREAVVRDALPLPPGLTI